jgi:hypothetical protein
VLIAAALCAVGCLYLWQVNDLSTLHERTLELQSRARGLEQQNVMLAEQLAQWNSPDYVDKLSTKQGYVVAVKRTIEAPDAAGPAVVAFTAGEPAALAAAPAGSQTTR